MLLTSVMTTIFVIHLSDRVLASPAPWSPDPNWAQQQTAGLQVVNRICDTLGESNCNGNIAPHIERSRAGYCDAKMAELNPCLTSEYYKYGTAECKKRLAAYEDCTSHM